MPSAVLFETLTLIGRFSVRNAPSGAGSPEVWVVEMLMLFVAIVEALKLTELKVEVTFDSELFKTRLALTICPGAAKIVKGFTISGPEEPPQAGGHVLPPPLLYHPMMTEEYIWPSTRSPEVSL